MDNGLDRGRVVHFWGLTVARGDGGKRRGGRKEQKWGSQLESDAGTLGSKL